MPKFTIGEDVRYVYDGQMREGFIRYENPDGTVNVIFRDNGDQAFNVSRDALRKPEGEPFSIKSEVSTTSASHSGEVGEIVAIGETASGKRAFKVRFESDLAIEWFTEDQVFIERTKRVIIPDL